MGTKQGGIAASLTTKARKGKDFYRRIGAMGGRKGRTGGFYAHPERASAAGYKSGRLRRLRTSAA
jgi:general stress protein YciG